jgi:PKD repeat protein
MDMYARARKLAFVVAAVAIVIVALPLTGSCSNPPAPIARFDGNPTVGGAPLVVQFNDKSSGAITSWRWNFGDGTVGTQRNPIHTYDTSGSFTVLLEVTGPGGSNKASKSQYITVLSIQQQANKERAAAAEAISECLRAAGVSQLDGPVDGWDGTAGSVTAGGGVADASTYLPAGVAPFRAKYDVDQSGSITFGVDVSWGGLIWDDTYDRWPQ